DAHWGSSAFVFVEDNTFTGPTASPGYMTATDGQQGGRFVFRYNTLTNVILQNHGTESGGRWRGIRAIELYNNTATTTYHSPFITMRSGNLLVHDNTLLGYGSVALLRGYRDFNPGTIWRNCDGRGPYDKNDGVVYASGTHTGSAGSAWLVDSTK